jgi:farnesyl-diphosphate farnesyltransferase
MPEWQGIQTGNVSDLEYQENILQGVSRTFALTIPVLPKPLSEVIGNAYLLCRIADTIEDEVSLSPDQKRHFSSQFIDVVTGRVSAQKFADELHPLLSDATLEAERDLIKNTARVIRLTHATTTGQRAAIERCITIMAKGMTVFQVTPSHGGLKDITHLDKYCYYVAGVVGEMLTELFCEYSEEIGQHRQEMFNLSVSFGQGLQMTNILKDFWEDRKRGVCWLPQDMFQTSGINLADASEERAREMLGEGLQKLIAITNAHLENALSYTLLIPGHEKGIRKFCLLALGMAVLTLRKIDQNRTFSVGKEVKITRHTVKYTVLTTNLAAGSDWMLRLLFRTAATGLPRLPSLVKFNAYRFRPHELSEVAEFDRAAGRFV